MDDLLTHIWGKTEKQEGVVQLHPLLFHLMDAGNVATVLWEKCLSLPTQQALAGDLGLDLDPAGRLIAFWISLHDLGKAGPAFQAKHPPAQAVLTSLGLPFPPPASYAPRPHALVSGWSLCEEMKDDALSPEALEALARVLSGHHGIWPDSDSFNDLARRKNLGTAPWRQARLSLIETLCRVFAPPRVFTFPVDDLRRNLFLTLLSGLMTVSDWLASMKTPFQAAGMEHDWQSYQPVSLCRAKQAVHGQGWTLWNDPSTGAPITFRQAFPELHTDPRPVQTAVFDHATGVSLPALALIEAPTGIGKTEIAFLLADHWLRRGGGRGLYVAMPTQATSNQMYDRAKRFLSHRYPGEWVNLPLAHGNALLSREYEETILNGVGEDDRAGVAALAWFLPRKRTLLAPFGVGTVDQIFLSVLQTRHFFVRLFGLYGKTVVFDEIHAYDAYQSELFCRLLAWLRALNVSVILLSATLPAAVREKFIAAYGGKSVSPGDGYPRLTLVHGGEARQIRLPEVASHPVALEPVGHRPDEVVAFLREQLIMGGCAAVICNTVKRAQTIYDAVCAADLAPGETHLFHARFPFAWRKKTEDLILDRFGPQKSDDSGQRPPKAIVIATQVVEQSLDLDFDLMVSELAPIDLLIQRAGRLHRHAHRPRPSALTTPRLALIGVERTPEGDPDFGPDTYVYHLYHLLRTEAVLAGRTSLNLPGEIPGLIEAVYGDQPLEVDEHVTAAIAQAYAQYQKETQASILNAKKRIILPPNRDDLLTRRIETLEEENPTVHSDFRALTREAPPGVSLVCLHQMPDGRLLLDPNDPDSVIEIRRAPSKEDVRRLLSYSLQVQRPDLVAYFAGQAPHPAWKEDSALRHSHPVVFQHGVHALPDLRLALKLDCEKGFSVEKEVR